jgi:hypothetical protein
MLILPKTYEEGQILTEADLDNLRSPLLTLLNSTRLDDSFLDLDQVVSSLIPAQKSLLVSKFTPTQAEAFIAKADVEGANNIRDKLPASLEEDEEFYVTPGFVNNASGDVTVYEEIIPESLKGMWLVSVRTTTQLSQAFTPSDGAATLRFDTKWLPAQANKFNKPFLSTTVWSRRSVSILTETVGFTQGFNVTSGSISGIHSFSFLMRPESLTNLNSRTLRLRVNVSKTSGLDTSFTFFTGVRVQYRRIW